MKVPDPSNAMKTVATTGNYFSKNRTDIQTGAYIGLVVCLSAALGFVMLIYTPNFK